mmetsp:Transcript_9394/g.17168  ORF Transcript_9394/g.17168 Transcript_9394/m.17168 type:complete len:82 (+) Transcript_9394:270-515(+)
MPPARYTARSINKRHMKATQRARAISARARTAGLAPEVEMQVMRQIPTIATPHPAAIGRTRRSVVRAMTVSAEMAPKKMPE